MQDYERPFDNYLEEHKIIGNLDYDYLDTITNVADLKDVKTTHGHGDEKSILNIFSYNDFSRFMSLPDSESKSRIHTNHADSNLNVRNQSSYETINNCVRTSLQVS